MGDSYAELAPDDFTRPDPARFDPPLAADGHLAETWMYRRARCRCRSRIGRAGYEPRSVILHKSL